MSNQVRLNPDDQRYEIEVDGVLAGFTVAHDEGDRVVFPHTEVFEQFEGRGLASELVSKALDDVRARGLKVKPVCPYVVRYVEKHSAYADLLV